MAKSKRVSTKPVKPLRGQGTKPPANDDIHALILARGTREAKARDIRVEQVRALIQVFGDQLPPIVALKAVQDFIADYGALLNEAGHATNDDHPRRVDLERYNIKRVCAECFSFLADLAPCLDVSPEAIQREAEICTKLVRADTGIHGRPGARWPDTLLNEVEAGGYDYRRYAEIVRAGADARNGLRHRLLAKLRAQHPSTTPPANVLTTTPAKPTGPKRNKPGPKADDARTECEKSIFKLWISEPAGVKTKKDLVDHIRKIRPDLAALAKDMWGKKDLFQVVKDAIDNQRRRKRHA